MPKFPFQLTKYFCFPWQVFGTVDCTVYSLTSTTTANTSSTIDFSTGASNASTDLFLTCDPDWTSRKTYETKHGNSMSYLPRFFLFWILWHPLQLPKYSCSTLPIFITLACTVFGITPTNMANIFFTISSTSSLTTLSSTAFKTVAGYVSTGLLSIGDPDWKLRRIHGMSRGDRHIISHIKSY